MENKIFRDKSVEKISDPEQLDDYIKVTHPAGFLFLGAVFLLILSFMIWASLGTLDVTVDSRAFARNGIMLCYLTEEEAAQVEKNMSVAAGTEKGKVEFVAELPESYKSMAEELGGEEEVHALGINENEWRYRVSISCKGEDGMTDVSIVTDRVSPMRYLFH